MKRNVIIKLFIDITMIILYVLLMFAQSLGGFFHETVGLGIGILFLIHIFLNCSMIKGLFKSVKKGTLGKRILLASDVILTICMPIVIITGIFIAKELFFIQSGISRMRLFDIHNVLSYICLGIMILHILLHTKYLLGVLKKLPSSISKKEMISAISLFLAGVIAAVILYSSLAIYKGTLDNQNCSENPDSCNNTNSSSTAPKNNSNNYTEPNLPSIDKDSELNDEENKTSITENTDAENSITTENVTSPPPTLEEYLSKLKCTGCSRGCFLLNPGCRKGKAQASQAEKEYNRIYNN